MKLKIGSDIIKVYKDAHTWAGIVCGLMLFIAFYAGAITMFEKPLERWATPPSQLAEAPPLEDADAAAIERFLDAVWAEQGLAPATLAAYRSDLQAVARWLRATPAVAITAATAAISTERIDDSITWLLFQAAANQRSEKPSHLAIEVPELKA